MKNIIAMSLEKCFEYVMDKKNSGYVLISIQDNQKGGFGISFRPTKHCKDVLELKFDDIEPHEKGTLFSEYDAERIIEFVEKHTDVDTLAIHCFGGVSRSQAVKHALIDCLGLEKQEHPWLMNSWVYETIIRVWQRSDSHDIKNNVGGEVE